MKKDALFVTVVYFTIGLFFFFGYYILMVDVISINPFQGWMWIPSVYFVIATVCYPTSGKIVNEFADNKGKTNYLLNWFVNVHYIIMPVAFVMAPIITLKTLLFHK